MYKFYLTTQINGVGGFGVTKIDKRFRGRMLYPLLKHRLNRGIPS